jgi:hypothetical protein
MFPNDSLHHARTFSPPPENYFGVSTDYGEIIFCMLQIFYVPVMGEPDYVPRIKSWYLVVLQRTLRYKPIAVKCRLYTRAVSITQCGMAVAITTNPVVTVHLGHLLAKLLFKSVGSNGDHAVHLAV